MDPEAVIGWAHGEAGRLRDVQDDPRMASDVSIGEIAAGTEFLRLHSGRNSQFFAQAAAAAKQQPYNAVETVPRLLDSWAEFVDVGLAEQPLEQRAKFEASTDLMEQVQVLLDDGRVHAAAPVVLAGAALEEFLRGLLTTESVSVKGKPGINSYAAALREAGVLDQQAVKDATAWAGMRNSAAHGEFDKVKIDNARLMAQAINLFMQQHAS